MSDKIKEALDILTTKLVARYGQDAKVEPLNSPETEENGENKESNGLKVLETLNILVYVPCDVNICMEMEVFDIAQEVGKQFDLVFGINLQSSSFWKAPPQ